MLTRSPLNKCYVLSSENGTCKTVKARFWPWLSGKRPANLSSCSLFSRLRGGALNSGHSPFLRSFRSKVDGFVPQPQDVNLRVVCQPSRGAGGVWQKKLHKHIEGLEC